MKKGVKKIDKQEKLFLRIAQIALIITTIDLLSGFIFKNNQSNLINIVSTIVRILTLFFIFNALSIISKKEKLFFLKKVIWISFVVFLIFDIFYFAITFYSNSFIAHLLFPLIFFIGIANIMLGMGLTKLERFHGKIMTFAGISFILNGISFWIGPSLISNEIFNILAKIVALMMTLSYALLIIVFDRIINAKR